jgi:hypothetical protein
MQLHTSACLELQRQILQRYLKRGSGRGVGTLAAGQEKSLGGSADPPLLTQLISSLHTHTTRIYIVFLIHGPPRK